MVTGTVEYGAPIAGLRLEPIEVNIPHPYVGKVVLKTEDDKQLRVTIHLIDIFVETDATAIATDILPSLIDRLAFHRNIPIGESLHLGFSLPKDASGSSYSVMSALHIKDSVQHVLTPNEDGRRELVEQLEQSYTHHDQYSLYRFAISQTDPVTRFMFLYNILLQLHNDSQKHIDDFIRQEETNVDQSPSPRHRGVMETVYTRLRNEVGHGRAGTTPEQTQAEIRHNVPTFQQLVRTAILRIVSQSPTQ